MCQCSCHDTLRRLARAVITLDASLPHESGTATDRNDETSPVWCEVFKKTLNTPGEECCNLCAEFSETTLRALDDAFASD